MKTIAILNALSINEYANVPICENKTSIELAIQNASKLPNVEKVIVLCHKSCSILLPTACAAELKTIDSFSSTEVYSIMHKIALDLACETVFFCYADAPFLDVNHAKKLFETHTTYNAEYTFSEGFPQGLSCEVLDVGLLSILARISKSIDIKHNRNFIFDSLKQNINSYDIEAIISDYDVQDLRLEFFASSKRSVNLCKHYTNITCENYYELIQGSPEKLFDLPAFYSIEICNATSQNKCYLPKLDKCENSFMPVEKFKELTSKLSTYSDDGVISLSIFGEPCLHPELLQIISTCLELKKFSLLIETSGVDLRFETIQQIKAMWESSNLKAEGQSLYWIVYLDAITEKTYGTVSNLDEAQAKASFEKAKETVKLLAENFPGLVYPQFIRMSENEDELEGFYRFWKESLDVSLIQKYDSLSGLLPNRVVADLSPVNRTPCWHLKRDVYILNNGDVSFCKAAAARKQVVGNAFTESLEAIRAKILPLYNEHTLQTYKGLCEQCDEYYTFNF